jgi:hypothetical protein
VAAVSPREIYEGGAPTPLVQGTGETCVVQEGKMELFHSENTCSITEIGGIGDCSAEDFDAEIKKLLAEAAGMSKRLVYINMHDWAHEKFGATLKANKFVFIGKYAGNSAPFVFMWVHGLVNPKPAPAARLKAIVRKVRKPQSR